MSILKETVLFNQFKANERRIEKLEKKYSEMTEYGEKVGFNSKKKADEFLNKWLETEKELKSELLLNKSLRVKLGMA